MNDVAFFMSLLMIALSGLSIIGFSCDIPYTISKLRGKRLVDEFHITVYTTHNKLKHIMLEKYKLPGTYSRKLYPVFYYDNGTTFIADSTQIKQATVYDGFSARDLCIMTITSILNVKDYQLKFAADINNVYIIIDNDAIEPDNFIPLEYKKSNISVSWE